MIQQFHSWICIKRHKNALRLALLLFSHWVTSDSLQLHGLQHSVVHHLTVCSDSCPLSQCCCLTISSSATLFFCFQSFPASESFLMSRLFASDGQSIGASASILPMNIQGWFPLGLTGLIFLQSKGLAENLLQHHNSKASVLWCSAFFMVQLSHLYVTTGKTTALVRWTFVGKIMSLLFNITV